MSIKEAAGRCTPRSTHDHGSALAELRGHSRYFETNWTHNCTRTHAWKEISCHFGCELFLPISETFSNVPSSIPVQLGQDLRDGKTKNPAVAAAGRVTRNLSGPLVQEVKVSSGREYSPAACVSTRSLSHFGPAPLTHFSERQGKVHETNLRGSHYRRACSGGFSHSRVCQTNRHHRYHRAAPKSERPI